MSMRGAILLPLLALVLVGSPGSLNAQENASGAKQQDAQPSEEQQEQVEAGGDLFSQTLARDIASAGFYELVAWLQSLDLPIDGERAALQRRLAGFYDVSQEQLQLARNEIEPAPGPTRTGRSIVIDSASRTRYFTIDEIDERYIRLSGDVILTLTDENDGTHRIRADEITLNQEQNTLSASGSVVYSLERGQTTERFIGEALTVQLDSFEGAFIRGQTEREREIEGEQVDFEFAGEYITRSEDDVIVLDNGRITSSEADPPNYHIRARKIWVLAPGEWGLSNATLYVGRVPLFYLPFFFRPGNRLFSNPSLGTNDRKGLYIQTTTYLLGRAEERESAFSFLQLTETNDDTTQLEREGLFLVSGESLEEPPPEGTIRLMIDFYSRLGAFVGVEGEVPRASVLRDVDFYSAIAASRHVYLTTAGYTPYFVADDDARIDWNETTFGSLSLPFRFGLSFAGSLVENGWNASVQYEWFSDRWFLSDFGNRTEQIDWTGLLGQGEVALPPGSLNELTWQLRGSYRPVNVDLPAALSTLTLQRVLFSLRFASREVDPALLPNEALLADQSPEAAFFYPTTMRLPDITGTLGGTLFTYPSRVDHLKETGEELPEITSPWQEPEVGDEAPRKESDPIAAPPLQASLPATSLLPSAFTADLSYRVTPSLLVDHQFDSSQWQQARDVDFQVAYRGASSRISAGNTLTVGVLDGLFGLNSGLSLSGQHRAVFDRADSVESAAWADLEQQAWNFTSLSLSNVNTATVRPLLYVPPLSQSNIAYTTDLLLYRYRFDELVGSEPTYTGEAIDWDDTEFVRRHELSATLAVEVRDVQQLTLTAILPPLDERYAASITIRRSPVTLTADTARAYVDGRWSFDPLQASLIVSFPTVLRSENKLTYDIDKNELSAFTSGLAWGDLSVRFEARNTEGYRFDELGAGWELEGERAVRPVSLDLSFNPRLIAEPFWRGRIAGTLNADVGVDIDFLRFTQSALNLRMNGTFAVHEFIALGFSFSSSNGQVYAYVPSLARQVGREPKRILPDLIRSLNLFSEEERRQSAFKFQTIQLGLIHDLGDWDLSVFYRANPKLQVDGPNSGRYTIDRYVELTLQWRPIEELSASARIEEGKLSIGDDS